MNSAAKKQISELLIYGGGRCSSRLCEMCLKNKYYFSLGPASYAPLCTTFMAYCMDNICLSG